MKLKHKIEIDLLAFFKTGKFDYLKIGQTKEWILHNFPDPDNTLPQEWVTTRGYDVWRYGHLELHFLEDKLHMIFSDYWDKNGLDAGENITVKQWVFENSQELTLLFILEKLNNHQIDFTKKTTPLAISVLLYSGVELHFENENEEEIDDNQYLLTAFSFRGDE